MWHGGFFEFIAVGNFVCVCVHANLRSCGNGPLLQPHQCPRVCEAQCWDVSGGQGCTQSMLAWPAFSSFIPSAHKRKAGKPLHLVVGPSCLLCPAHLKMFGCFWLCSCNTRNAGEDYYCLFFFLISLVIIGGALLLKTLISLCDSNTLGKQPQLFLLPLVVFLVMCL